MQKNDIKVELNDILKIFLDEHISECIFKYCDSIGITYTCDDTSTTYNDGGGN